MTTNELPNLGGGAAGARPPAESKRRRTWLGWARAWLADRPTWLKLAVLLVLLALLAYVVLLIAQYCRTGKPVSELPIVPAPVQQLLVKPPLYASSLAGVQRPLGVAVAPDGKVFVTETGGERKVHVFDSSGQEIGAFAPPDTTPGSRTPVYVAVSPQGKVYVSDRSANAIQIFGEDGSYLGTVPSPLAGGHPWQPLGLTFDKAGNLYVTEVTDGQHRVLVLDPEGKLKLEFGKQGTADGEFWFPNAVTVDGDGRIYVADSNNGRVQVFDPAGTLLYKIGRGLAAGDLSMPRGIAIEGSRLFVVDVSRQAVQVYQTGATPKFLYVFGEDAAGNSTFQYPNGLAIDSRGWVYVTDRENNRVQVWRPQ